MSENNQLSFLPDDYLETKTQKRANMLWAALFIIVAGGIGYAYYYAEKSIREEETANAHIRQQFTDAEATLTQFKQLEQAQKQLDLKAKLSGSLVENVLPSEILARLTNLLPENTTLKDVSMESRKAKTNTAPLTALERLRQAQLLQEGALLPEPISYEMSLKVVGLAPSDPQVAQYLSNLSAAQFAPEMRVFSDVNLVVTEDFNVPGSDDGKRKAVRLRRFEIELTLNAKADTRLTMTAATQPSATQPSARAR